MTLFWLGVGVGVVGTVIALVLCVRVIDAIDARAELEWP